MPLDPAPQNDGNVIISSNGSARVIGDDERARYPGPIFKSHFATCPNAAEHRKR